MSNNVRTKLELLNDGPSTPRKQSRRRKPSKKKEQVQELNIQEIEALEAQLADANQKLAEALNDPKSTDKSVFA